MSVKHRSCWTCTLVSGLRRRRRVDEARYAITIGGDFGNRLKVDIGRAMDQLTATTTTGSADRDCVAPNEAANTSAAASAEVQCAPSASRYRGDRLRLALEALLLPGPGLTRLSKNGETVIELQGLAPVDSVSVNDAERLALAEPQHEWCIHIVSLLDDRRYRREGPGLWRLFARGYGLS